MVDDVDAHEGVDDVPAQEGVAEAFTDLAGWAADSSPLYERIGRIVADDPELLELAAAVPEDRSTANVFLAAVQFLLLRGADHPLADYYPSVTETPRAPDDSLSDRLRDFCETYEDDLRPLLATRRTQTNSVRRAAALYPAISHVARQVDGPLALVELGPSAGLNLLFDRYRYEFGDRTAGPVDAPATVRTTVRGDEDPPLPDDPPAVHSRVGIDLNPMDVTDPDDADWLRALVWPEHDERRRTLEGAIETAQRDPPNLVTGDLLEDLPAVLADVPDDVPVCVFDTLVLYQVPEAVREQLDETVREFAARRPLHWLAGETVFGDQDGIRLEWTRAEDGEVRTDLLAAFEQHGDWVEWRPDEDAT